MPARMLLISCGLVALCALKASAQVHIHQGMGHGGYFQPHIDHHDHVIVDSHGHSVGVQHHDIIHDGSHVIPSPIIGGSHIDHHDHIIQDFHGHVVGTEHHDVMHSNWSHVVPSNISGYSTGQYYVEGENHYYAPAPAPGNSGSYTSAKPALVPYGGFNQTDDLSGRLETLVNETLLDLHYNYRHNPGFAETYGEAYQLLDAAKFIHAADHNNDREAIRSKINGTDQLFHHIEDDVRGWSRNHQRQIRALGILTKMELVEATLHHLMNDVGVSASDQPPQSPLSATQMEQAPPPPGYSPSTPTAPRSYRSAPADKSLGDFPPPATVP